MLSLCAINKKKEIEKNNAKKCMFNFNKDYRIVNAKRCGPELSSPGSSKIIALTYLK